MPSLRTLRAALLVLGLGGAAGAQGLDAPPASEPRKASPATAGKPGSPPPLSPAPGPATAAPATATAHAAPNPPAVAAPSARPKPLTVPNPVKLSSDPRPALDPGTFINTLRAVERHLALAEAGGWPALPAGTILKSGDRGPLVPLLRRRLSLSEDLPPHDATFSDAFDAPLLAAVRRFQFRHGLPETGTVAERTLAALNVPAEFRARQLSASAGRLAGSAFPFGERYVVVNIPSATVEAVEGGEVKRRYVAVAGKKDRPSPAVETRIQAVNLNPTWTVPVSLVRKDIIPHMRKDPSHLSAMRIRVLDGTGAEVDPAAIDWSTERAVNYTLRQDPGAENSLGRIRIDMPNRHAVYLHDTPTKRLFAQGARFHSSGCVRVADVESFAAWLLEGTPAPGLTPTPGGAPASGGVWTRPAIEAAIETGERQDIKLAKPVPVAWVYLTGYATADGTVHFRDDVYGLDTVREPAQPAPDDIRTSSIEPRRP
jgi:murein L,D-transpeptidase YcbB/YkuD